MKRTGIFIALLVIMSSMMYFEEKEITGTVTSAQDGSPIPGVNVKVKGTTNRTMTNINGYYSIKVPESGTLVFSLPGYATKEVKVGNKGVINVAMEMRIEAEDLAEVAATQSARKKEYRRSEQKSMGRPMMDVSYNSPPPLENYPVHNTEEYDAINENIFHGALKNPLSTFSIDVDAASYSNVRRFLNNGQLPPKDAVRIEEMVNYFSYDYPQPDGQDPFSITTEISAAPWNTKHKLVHIGLQGRKISTEKLPPSNLVFLIDVSGSMSSANKLPLLKSAFKLLVDELRPQDNVAIVVYAGAAGLVLPSTAGSDKETIINALEQLSAGGSTAGGAGINLAYNVAQQHFKKGGNNRVILATDGDFNVGASSNAEMERLIEEKRDSGIFLTVLGFGMGNYKDSKMEVIADKGNGNYAYIDNILEAKKVFVNEFGGTLFTIAKDVKIQVEFNPAKVKAYRLIGYENRALRNEDFNNDKKDAGELGAGHTVTALYEIIPVGVESQFDPIDELKYQENKIAQEAYKSKELMTVKLRYKQPDGDKSKLITHALMDNQVDLDKTSANFKWSAAVAGFGMLLRNSEFKGDLTHDDVLKLAQESKGSDQEGYRIEFINMVKSFGLLARK
ncbi:Von Willebrand factor type A domain protein [Fulvivirga imtechensis AK7]|uniref:von Willebrand factor type A domain protein n=1 Tax=Fulvivirga imtechensis AK7 TaxID=1237149 RepID=L8JWQ2_9BACT|nr:von Willebrand factor type A domain-containing protein [Fulvivirga imtechensis]ELR72628.1 Von Willebrand factor type A domain protein [Fulvivirga imtechensis AK7]